MGECHNVFRTVQSLQCVLLTLPLYYVGMGDWEIYYVASST